MPSTQKNMVNGPKPTLLNLARDSQKNSETSGNNIVMIGDQGGAALGVSSHSTQADVDVKFIQDPLGRCPVTDNPVSYGIKQEGV